MAYASLSGNSRLPSTGGTYASLSGAAGVPPPDSGGGLLHFLGNIGHGIEGIASGAVGLVGNFAHDVAKEGAMVLPGHQAIEEDSFRTADMVQGLAGFTDHGFHPLDPSSLIGGMYHRYEPLLPGGTPAHEAYQQFYDNPVSYALDALGAGKVLGKTAEATLGGAIEEGGLTAAKDAATQALKDVGFAKTPAVRAGMRSALDELSAQGSLSPLQTLLSKTLPKATSVRVADELVPSIDALNPVARAVAQNRFVAKLGTEPMTAFSSRVEQMGSEIHSYLSNRGWTLDEAGQVVDKAGSSVTTKAPKQLLTMAQDYRTAKALETAATEAKLTRIATDKAASSVAGSIARKMLGQLGASGLMARNDRIAAYTNTIGPDILAHPEIVARSPGLWQGLDITVNGFDRAGWTGRPLEWDAIDAPRNISITPDISFSSGGDAVPGGYNGYYVAYDKAGNKLGYIDYQSASHDPQATIAMVDVSPEYQRQGIGRALVSRLQQDFPEAPLDWGYTTPEGEALRQSVQRSALLTDLPAPALQDAQQLAPEWLSRSQDLVAGWQSVKQHMMDYPAEYVGTDIAQASDYIDRHIDGLNRSVQDIVRASRGEIDPAFGTAGKVNIVSMEQSRPLWTQGVLSPQSLFERKYLPVRLAHGAVFDKIEDVFKGGPDPKAIDDALRAADSPSPIYFPHIDPASIGSWDFFRSKKTVGSLTATADPSLKRDAGKLLESGSYITDPTEAFARRAARSVRAEETFRVFQTMADRWGRVLAPGDTKGTNEVYWIPELEGLKKRTGLGIQDVMDDLTSKGVSREEAAAEALKTVNDNVDYVRNLIDSGGPTKAYAVPKIVAEQLDAAAKWAKAFGPNTKFGAFYDSYMNAWRHLTLFTRPAYVMNQFLGNTVWAELHGAGLGAPAEVIGRRLNEELRAKYGDAIPDQVLAKLDELPGHHELQGGFNASLERTYTPRNPKFEASAAGRLTHRLGSSRPAGWGKAFMETERKMASELDQAFRTGGFIHAAERQMGINVVKRTFGRFKGLSYRLDRLLKGGFGEDASVVKATLDEAKQFYGDFNSMTAFERHVIRRYVFPWWGFTRHNLKLMLTYPMDYPGRAELMQAITTADQQMRTDEYGAIPDYLSGGMPFGPAGGSVPFFSMRGASPFEGAMQNPLSQLSPIASVGYQLATGKNQFTGQPFTAEDVVTPYGSDQQFRIIRDDAGNVTDVVPVDGKVTPGVFELLARTFPLYSYAERFASGDASTYDNATLIDLLRGKGMRLDSNGVPIDREGRLAVFGSLVGLPINQVDLAGYQDRLASERKAAYTAALSRSTG